jgi:DTW domain-containing protein YfiP
VSAAVSEPRAMCAACRRPEVVCYCRFVTRLETKTRVVILQHPRERDVPINTARIASLCLPNAEVHVGVAWNGVASLPNAALLYPGPDAIDIEESPPSRVAPITLVVVDGTWWQAKKLVRSTPALASLPRYAFRPRAPSDYRIRREPREDYVSTIEALAHVLGVLEGDHERFLPLLAPFRAMVDAQIAFADRHRTPRRLLTPRRRDPRDPFARLPALLRQRASDLVCVHAEADAWPYGVPNRAPEALVQWVACRVATGETFEMLVSPGRALCPATAFHLEVDASEIHAGPSRASLHEAWSRFVRPTDVICSWGDYAPSVFEREGGSLPSSRVDLRRAARLFACSSIGTMDAFCMRYGQPKPPLTRGRAGRRLSSLVTISRILNPES